MKFYLVDRIESIEPGKRIVATKCLTAAEEYLADHFPAFPVMPGVMMLEACVQTSAWLVRLLTDWSVSMIVMKAARNVRYASFVAPGNSLRVEADLIGFENGLAKFNCQGTVESDKAVQAKIELHCFNLAERDPQGAWADRRIIEQMKHRFKLCGGADLLAAMETAAPPA